MHNLTQTFSNLLSLGNLTNSNYINHSTVTEDQRKNQAMLRERRVTF